MLETILDRLKTIFSIDLRSLALFRIGLAVLIIADLISRARDLSAFYTDGGVLSRAESIANSHFLQVSLYWISGNQWIVGGLFVLAGLVALLLGLGYRTRLMAILSWMLLLSLQNRNPFFLVGSDNLLLVLSFWVMFLPIHARWSIDAALSKSMQTDCNHPPLVDNKYFSIVSVAALLQVAYLYFFTAILKTGDPWRVTMDAAYYAVHLDQFATVFGLWIGELPILLTIGTYFVWWLEILMPFLVFSPVYHVPLRLLGIALLVVMHGAFFLSLNIGLFPFIDFLSLTLFLPTAFWNWISHRIRNDARDNVVIYFDRDCGFCKKTCLILRTFLLPTTTPILIAQDTPDIYAIMERENSWVVKDYQARIHTHWGALQYLFTLSPVFRPLGWLMGRPSLLRGGNRIYRWVALNRGHMGDLSERFLPYRKLNTNLGLLGTLAGAYSLYVVTSINISGIDQWSINKPQHVALTEKVLRLNQKWNMFAPYPLTLSMIPVIPGKLRDGTEVDVYQMQMTPPTWEYPEILPYDYKNYRWRKYLGRVRSSDNNRIRRGYGGYLGRQWNSRDIPKDKQLATFEIHFKTLRTLPNYAEREPHTHRVWTQWGFEEFARK